MEHGHNMSMSFWNKVESYNSKFSKRSPRLNRSTHGTEDGGWDGARKGGVCRRRLPSVFEGKIRESGKASADYRGRKTKRRSTSSFYATFVIHPMARNLEF